MVITVMIEGTKHAASVPYRDAPHVEIKGLNCQKCKAPAPLRVQGLGIENTTHDTMKGRARTICCSAMLGAIEVKFSTLFGIEEDQAVVERVTRAGGKVY